MDKCTAAYERNSIHTFHDICMGKVQNFDMIVYASIKIGDHSIAIASEVGDSCFHYIVVDQYIQDCHYGLDVTLAHYRYLIELYRTKTGNEKKRRLDSRRPPSSRY